MDAARLLHAGSGVWRVFTRAVAGCLDCCLLEETTIDFPIRIMPKLGAGVLDAKFAFSQYCE